MLELVQRIRQWGMPALSDREVSHAGAGRQGEPIRPSLLGCCLYRRGGSSAEDDHLPSPNLGDVLLPRPPPYSVKVLQSRSISTSFLSLAGAQILVMPKVSLPWRLRSVATSLGRPTPASLLGFRIRSRLELPYFCWVDMIDLLQPN